MLKMMLMHLSQTSIKKVKQQQKIWKKQKIDGRKLLKIKNRKFKY